MSDWLKIAARRDIRIRSLKVGAVVGTVLTTINYGDLFFQGVTTSALIWKIPLTYCVPYCVSTFASVQAAREID